MVFNGEAVLRYIVAIHFFYMSMILMVGWLPSSYHYSQMAIFLLGLWAIVNRESALHVELLMVVKCFSILFDIIAIGMYFQIGKMAHQDSRPYFIFSAFFAIFLLILKPAMLLLLNQVRKDRLGDTTSPTFGKWGSSAGHVPGYQPVDEQPAPNNV